ncbi:hypothetical protein [Streptomyces sp. NPDC088736]|uniref:hypothetical protein n=1 Tax=Streptomyces sp. NPDC088736 TaxID=3365881 RepID=UPI0037F863C8
MTEATPTDDRIWLQQRPCGCTVAAVVAAVPGAWTLTTAEQANEHLNPNPADRDRAARAGLAIVAVGSREYREKYRSSWQCDQHATPTR